MMALSELFEEMEYEVNGRVYWIKYGMDELFGFIDPMCYYLKKFCGVYGEKAIEKIHETYETAKEKWNETNDSAEVGPLDELFVDAMFDGYHLLKAEAVYREYGILTN